MFIAILGGLLALYLYAIKPASPGRKNIDPFLGRYYAHRGLFDNKSDSPENSLKAINHAVDENYGVEFNVRLTKDKIPVVLHDSNLKRVSGLDKDISELYFHDLRKITLFESKDIIPTLQEVLEAINGRVPVIVELKLDDGADTAICDISAPFLDEYQGDYMVESFNPMPMLWYKKNRPSVIRGQLSTNHFKEGKKGFLMNLSLQYLLFNFLVKPDFIAYDHLFRHNISFLLNKKIFGITTVAYTMKSQQELMKNKDFFDILIFDGFIPQ